MFLGDATGHGIGAAFMTMMVGTGLDSIGPAAPVEETLTRLHHLIHERTTDRFVTGIYARISPAGLLVHGSAGHPPIVYVPRGARPRLLDGEAGFPLGLLEPPLPFGPYREQLQPGDRLYLYTDGLLEWLRPDGQQFALERALRCLEERRDDPLQASVDGLVAAAREFAAGAPPTDDVTVIGLEYRG